jgi:hypothetical protein
VLTVEDLVDAQEPVGDIVEVQKAFFSHEVNKPAKQSIQKVLLPSAGA